MSTDLPWLCPCCGVSLGSSESVKSSSAPVSARSSWPCPWPWPTSVGPTFTSAKNRSKISSNTSSSRRSLISATRRAALRWVLSASMPGSRAQAITSRASGIEIRTCRSRSRRTNRCSAFSISPPRGRLDVAKAAFAALSAPNAAFAAYGPGSQRSSAAQARAEAPAPAVRRHRRLRGRRTLGLHGVAGPVVGGVVAPLGVLGGTHRAPVELAVVGRGHRVVVLVVVVPVAMSVSVAMPVPVLRNRRVGVDEPGQRLERAPDVAVVLHDHRRGVREHRRRQLLRTEHRQRPRPVDRLRDRRRLAQLQLPDPAHDLHQLRR